MTLLSVEEALSRVTADIEALPAEEVPLREAGQRVLAEDLAARITQPPFHASAMDGYAARTEDIKTLPSTLNIIGEAAAGHGFSGSIGSEQAVRIFTGAPVPEGADTIVIQENTKKEGDSVTVLEHRATDRFIRPRGFDFSEGDILLKAGQKLTARDLALAAAMNHANVIVHRQPRVAILATGDELVLPGERPASDQIISSIPYGLASMVEAVGGQADLLGIAKDTTESLQEAIARAQNADILVTIGGASVGDHDLVQAALREEGMTLDFWKIAMRPGKPLMFGRLGSERVLGVPGNPVSALICARIFLVPMIHRLSGLANNNLHSLYALLTQDLEKNGIRQHYMRANLGVSVDGEKIVTPIVSQDSSLLAEFSRANCFIVREPFAPTTRKGSKVQILMFDF